MDRPMDRPMDHAIERPISAWWTNLVFIKKKRTCYLEDFCRSSKP